MFVSTSAASDKLTRWGLTLSRNIHYQSSSSKLVLDTLALGEGILSDTGALVIKTGKFTGRSPRDKYLVKEAISESLIDWNEFNNPLTLEQFDQVCLEVQEYLIRLPQLWVRDEAACADNRYQLPLRVICEKPWSALFAANMFLKVAQSEYRDARNGWQIFVAPGCKLSPESCGTRRENATVISFRHRIIIIAGTGYTGEIKKSVFTVLNYLLPRQHQVLGMHCAANVGETGDCALFFGLSGTGKTTLSVDASRKLIGDDEHGWSENGIFNFEGGCYAKVINLDPAQEPEIYRALQPGALLENTRFYPGSTTVDFSDASITQNTRVSYPIQFIDNAHLPSVCGVPSNMFFLTCDAHGILPPISRLTRAQAMYHFLSGYTAKIAGTEAGINEPVATFSACFGAPFLPLHPTVYSSMLGDRLKNHAVTVWLVNTGWTGGPFGMGTRISLRYTRRLINAALTGELDHVEYQNEPVFGLSFPASCPGVPASVLSPRQSWHDQNEYDSRALILAGKFRNNFQQYSRFAEPEISGAGPVI